MGRCKRVRVTAGVVPHIR